eukprot:TRINITY_DN61367_c0_g1_i1.p1 TRINITY_DN61367_c0_g1~~TRINITY_DN61367_c0_g1_i1.p1  ORF type:complete len:208 (-),score=29.66 TRINITY_DN61367_c0_g1_i1:140-763(-)
MTSSKPMGLWARAVQMAKNEVTKDAHELGLLTKRIYGEMRRTLRLANAGGEAQSKAAPHKVKREVIRKPAAVGRPPLMKKEPPSRLAKLSAVSNAMHAPKAAPAPGNTTHKSTAAPMKAMKAVVAPTDGGDTPKPKSVWARAVEMAENEHTANLHERTLLAKRIYCQIRRSLGTAVAAPPEPAPKPKPKKLVIFKAATMKVVRSTRR